MKMKKLNRKGFTLIELLAVIVILAVVMGIATNSILNTMNNSRGGALIESADIIKRGMDQRLVSSQLTSGTAVIEGTSLEVGTGGTSTITKALGEQFGLSSNDYVFDTDSSAPRAVDNPATKSFIYYNNSNDSFVVCLVANRGGKNYVEAFTAKNDSKVLISTASINAKTGFMIGCSDNTKTW